MELKKPSTEVLMTGILMLAITVYGWLQLPDQIALHFTATGEPDSFTGKTIGLLIMPLTATGLYILLKWLPEIDPLGENIREFSESYNHFITVTAAFLTYIQAIIVAWNLGYTFSMSQALAPAIAALYFIMGDLIEKTERNWFIGIRNPWTLSSEEIWDKTHEKCGPLFKVAAIIALLSIALPEYFLFLTVFPALAVAAYSTIYSFNQYRKKA